MNHRVAERLRPALLAIAEPFIRWSPGFLVIIRSAHFVALTRGYQANVPKRLSPLVQVPAFTIRVHSVIQDRVALTAIVDLEGGTTEVGIRRVFAVTSETTEPGPLVAAWLVFVQWVRLLSLAGVDVACVQVASIADAARYPR